jgi:Ala-tRNA(Pro) deacylase
MSSPTPAHEKLVSFLNDKGVVYKMQEHEACTTSEQSANVRGVPLKQGAKALLIKSKQQFYVIIIPADRALDSKKAKKLIKGDTRFASENELLELTGLTKGALPPFGNIFGLKMVVDDAVFEEEDMCFNAASLTHSIFMKTADYRKLVETDTIFGNVVQDK